MFGLFKKKETKNYLPLNSAREIVHCVSTMEEAKLANVVIGDVNPKHREGIQQLRDQLCDKTFKIFLEQYGSKTSV